jgi:ribonuclease III
MNDCPRDAFQLRLGHRFARASLLDEALTHPSFLQDEPAAATNQRLEFLGDAVIQLVLTDALFHRYPDEREGRLSRRRSALTSGPFLASLARDLGLPVHLRVGAGEESTGGRERPAALEDALEAIAGAIYCDAGLEAARGVILGWYGDLDARLAALERGDNPKGRLQELIQPRHGNDALRYEVVVTEGEDHARSFEVVVRLHDQVLGRGRGTSKKLAEEAAAREALENGVSAV